jgi:NTP pyrophosphatase (non-canonical NTP hydrolase)
MKDEFSSFMRVTALFAEIRDLTESGQRAVYLDGRLTELGDLLAQLKAFYQERDHRLALVFEQMQRALLSIIRDQEAMVMRAIASKN